MCVSSVVVSIDQIKAYTCQMCILDIAKDDGLLAILVFEDVCI